MPSEVPEPWASFLGELDELLPEPVELHCLGGFVLAAVYGLTRPTGDVDYVSITPPTLSATLMELAGEGSPLWKKHRLFLQRAAVATPPEDYASRLSEPFARQFRNLRLMMLDPYDLVLSKLERNQDRDREDVKYLADHLALDPNILRDRYYRELRPVILGDRKYHDQTLAFWIEEYFGPSAGGTHQQAR